MGPWEQYPAGDPRADPNNWNVMGQYTGPQVDGWSQTGVIYEATVPPTDYGGGAPSQPAYSITGGGEYTGYPAPGAPAQSAYDPLSSAYPVASPTYGTGTPGTGTGLANPYDPSQVAAGEQAAYETLLANGGIPLVTDPGSAPPPYVAPAADPYAVPAATDPYGGTAAGTDPYTGQPSYEASYSVGGGGYGADPSAPAAYPYPVFGQSAMNPGRQQQVIPGQFDPFAWSGNPNPMPAPNETRQMILGAMQLGAEIEQQRAQQPVMNATNYALHRLGLTKPDDPAPQIPAAGPQRSRFGF